jgi:hypothetical protein
MKKIYLLLVCCLVCSNIATAQTHFNNTIVNENSSWATLLYGLGSYDIPCCVSTEYLFFDGDSTTNGNSYKKVFSCDDSLHENVKYIGLIREENNKTYFISATHPYPGTECLLYDFSLEEGMSFEYSYFCTDEPSISFYVNTVDYVEINGVMKKRIELTFLGRTVDVWVEGIGSMSGLLYSLYNEFLSGGVRLLLCYFQDNELIYKNSLYSECYYDDPDDIVSVKPYFLNEHSITIFPNPTAGVLNLIQETINNEQLTINNIEIFDIYGRKQKAEGRKQNVIDISQLSAGIYFVKISTETGEVVKKIIKN